MSLSHEAFFSPQPLTYTRLNLPGLCSQKILDFISHEVHLTLWNQVMITSFFAISYIP